VIVFIVTTAALTVLLCTALVCSAITLRPKTPCMFQRTYVYVGGTRIGDGHPCTGRADNVYLSTSPLNDRRVCDRHVGHLLDAVIALAKQ
jgi:hypothetical protein